MGLADRVGRRMGLGAAIMATVAVAMFSASAALAQEKGASGDPASDAAQTVDMAPRGQNVPLVGAEVGIEGSGRTQDGAPVGTTDRLFIEVPEGCRVVAGEGFSMAVEGEDGTTAEIVGGDGVRVSMRGGKLEISTAAGGGLDVEPSGAEVVGAEGFFCREARGGDPDVLAQTESGTREEGAETRQSAGQQTEPLEGTATINRVDAAADGDIESIEIAFDCETGEEIMVAEGASITLKETGASPEQFQFTDGSGGASIAESGSTVTISPTGGGFVLEPVDDVGGGDGELTEDSATVASQSGIACEPTTSTGGPGGDGRANTAAQCPSGQSLTDITAFSNSATTGIDMDTDSFTTTGSSFQIRYDATSTASTDDFSFEAMLQRENGEDTGETFTLPDGDTMDSEVRTVNLPAGTYKFRVSAENVQYNLTVAECRTASANTADAGSRQGIVAGTIPNKRLANTGGPSLPIIAAGVFIAGVGAALMWILARRGRGV